MASVDFVVGIIRMAGTYMARAGLATSRDSHMNGHEIWIWYSFCLTALLTFHSAVLANTVGRKDG